VDDRRGGVLLYGTCGVEECEVSSFSHSTLNRREGNGSVYFAVVFWFVRISRCIKLDWNFDHIVDDLIDLKFIQNEIKQCFIIRAEEFEVLSFSQKTMFYH